MSSTLDAVVRQVEADITRRGLTAGDKYLTGTELGRLLNVSSMTANRAMQQLAERGVLVRRRKKGTFVGNAAGTLARTTRRRVHVLSTVGIGVEGRMPANDYLSQLLGGIVETMTGVSVQVDMIGPQEASGFIKQITEDYRQGEVAGVVLIRSSLETQRRLAQSGVPTAVFGNVYPGVHGIASVEVDQYQIGLRTAEYLYGAGHARAMLLMLSQWAPGDNKFMAGFLRALPSADQLAIDLESVPVDRDVADHMIESALTSRQPPTAIVARSPWLARQVADVTANLGLAIPDQLDLIVGNHHVVEVDGRQLPRARSLVPMDECGRRLGQMLQRRAGGEPAESLKESVSVKFVADEQG